MNQRMQIPMIMGLTHMDCLGAWSEENIALALGMLIRKQTPIVTLNANETASVAQAVIALVQHFMQSSVNEVVTQ